MAQMPANKKSTNMKAATPPMMVVTGKSAARIGVRFISMGLVVRID